MKNQTRLVDEGADEFELGLLRSAERDAPGDGAQHRLLAALAVASVATTAARSAGAAGTGAPASTGTALVVAKWVAIAVLAGGVTVAGLYSLAGSHERAAPAVVSPPTSVSQVPSNAPAPIPDPHADLAPNPTTPSESSGDGVLVMQNAAPSMAPRPTPLSSARPNPAAPLAAPSTGERYEAVSEPAPRAPANAEAESAAVPDGLDPTLAAEVRAIDQARSSLRERRAVDALRVLDAYASSFPNGTFEPEATALRVEALIATGNRAEAERLGQAFLRAHPKSPVARQVQALMNP